MRTQIILESANEAKIVLPTGKVVTIRTDDGSAAQLAHEMIDWTAMFQREDAAEEVTQIIELAS